MMKCHLSNTSFQGVSVSAFEDSYISQMVSRHLVSALKDRYLLQIAGVKDVTAFEDTAFEDTICQGGGVSLRK